MRLSVQQQWVTKRGGDSMIMQRVNSLHIVMNEYKYANHLYQFFNLHFEELIMKIFIK